jgi:hypothetical protein
MRAAQHRDPGAGIGSLSLAQQPEKLARVIVGQQCNLMPTTEYSGADTGVGVISRWRGRDGRGVMKIIPGVVATTRAR